LRGKSGWLSLSKLTTQSVEEIEKLIFSAHCDDGTVLDQQQWERLMLIPAHAHPHEAQPQEATHIRLEEALQTAMQEYLFQARELNNNYFDE